MCLIDKNKKSPSLEVLDGAVLELWSIIRWPGPKSPPVGYWVKVTGDSLLIHESAYSLFIDLCLVTPNMTGYSHSYHSIKLIHCGAPQRDVLSDKMVFEW